MDRVRATRAPFTAEVRFDFGPVVLHGVPTPVDGISDAVCIRRTVLDTLLTDAAAEAGAEVWPRFTVKELLWDDGRVVGIRGRDASGGTVVERAPVVVGADGAGSFVARAVGAPTYLTQPGATFNVYSYWRGLDVRAVELYARPGRFVVAVPTNDDLVMVGQAVPAAAEPHHRGRIGAAFEEGLAELPHLGDRVRRARRVERFPATLAHDSFFRVPAGPGWALVGDAGYHKDPITAQGMLDAFRDAELLATAIDRGLTGGVARDLAGGTSSDLAHALRGYQRARDEAAMAMYEFTCGLAHVETPLRRTCRRSSPPSPTSPSTSPASSGCRRLGSHP